MNLVHLTNTYPPHISGVARAVDTLARETRRAGHRVLVVAPRFEAPVPPDPPDTLRLHALQHFNGSDFAMILPTPLTLQRRLEAFRPDLVHAHQPFLMGATAVRTAHRLRRPLFFTQHTLYERYTHYVPLDSPRMKTLAIELSTGFANLCTQVIAPSQSIARLLRERGVERPIAVIPTGIDSALFASGDRAAGRYREHLPPDAPILGTVGRLAPEKNLGYLARAFLAFLHQRADAHILFVGQGPERQRLQTLFYRAGVASRVHWAGPREGAALADAYAALDVFAFASVTETQGIVLAEAFAAGLPVCALDAPGVRDILRDPGLGACLPASTPPQDFARALGRLLDAPRGTFVSAARAAASAFDARTCTHRLIDLYQAHLAHPVVSSPPSPSTLEALQRRLRTEWELLAHKAGALSTSLHAPPAPAP